MIAAAFAGRDAHDAGLVEQLALDVGEVEGAVRGQRTAEAGTELLLVHRQRGVRQGVLAVEGIVAKEAVARAMERVGAASGHDVDVAAERPAELRLAAARHHLELFDRVHAEGNAAQAGGIVVGRQAVDDEAVGEVALAGDGQPLTRHRGRFGEQLRAVGVGGRHAGNEQRQVEEVPAVHRQVLDLRLRHRADDLAARGFERLGVGDHRDGGVDAGDVEA